MRSVIRYTHWISRAVFFASQCKRIISTGGSSDTDAETGTDSYEKSTGDSGEKRMLSDLRPKRIEGFEYGVKQRETGAGYKGVPEKSLAQAEECKSVAQNIQNQAGNSRRDMKPLLQEKGKPKNAALCNMGRVMNMIQPECQNHAAQQAGHCL